MPLPTRRVDPYKDVDVDNFSTAHELRRDQQLLMADIAESRGNFDAGSMWKSLAMNDMMVEADQKAQKEAQGTPLVEQQPAPAVPKAETTFDRSEPASRMVELPPVPPEPSKDDAREFVRDGNTRTHPDAAIAAQDQRNQELLAAQIRGMR